MTQGKSRILIVEDIGANSRLLEKHLGKDYEIHLAASGEEALKVVEDSLPDLILLDIIMPGMDGFEVCRAFKDNPTTMHIPVVFLTSLSESEDETRGLKLGAVDYVTKPFRMPVVKARIHNHLELKRARDLLSKQAFIDGLTGIPNRRQFDTTLESEWFRAMRNGSSISLILADIDFFKKYNDNYGHAQGDVCLRQVGHIFSEIVERHSDTVARYGGEEFAVILPETETEGALAIADAIQDALTILSIPHEFSSAAPHVTISQGIATMRPQKGQDARHLIETADKALYEAKEAGRNRAKASKSI